MNTRKHSIEYISKLIMESGIAGPDQLADLVRERIEEAIENGTEIERWDDPGSYPNSAGAGPLSGYSTIDYPEGDQEFQLNVPFEAVALFEQKFESAWEYINAENAASGNVDRGLAPEDVDEDLYGYVRLDGDDEGETTVKYTIRGLFENEGMVYASVFVEEN